MPPSQGRFGALLEPPPNESRSPGESAAARPLGALLRAAPKQQHRILLSRWHVAKREATVPVSGHSGQ
eukprot:610179-Alexandrium_andersonii.AAC.1